MSDAIYFPPLDKGDTVATITVTAEELLGVHAVNVEDLRAAHEDGCCDMVLLSVPEGEGMAVEAAIRRALHVEGTP